MIRAMPVLQVSDVSVSEAFYCEKLGFTSHGAWGEGPAFCIVGRGDVSLALDRSRNGTSIPVNQYWAAYIYVDNADNLCTEFAEKGVEIIRRPEDMPYGCRDFDIRDPDGHAIGFGHNI